MSAPRQPDGRTVRVLLVEDGPDYAVLVCSTLEQAPEAEFEVDHVPRLDLGLGLIEQRQPYDVMLLDLSLPDGLGAFTLGCVCTLANQLPVVVLTGAQDDELAMAAMRAGAQEYLVKDSVDRHHLPATVLRAIERHRRTRKLCAIESEGSRYSHRVPTSDLLVDAITGLPNDLVFGDRLGHAIARAMRNPHLIAVLLLRVDQLDQMGEGSDRGIHEELLAVAGEALGELVRGSDTLARVGVDSFGVILDGCKTVDDVCQATTALMMALGGVTHPAAPAHGDGGLTASIGIALYPDCGITVEQLMDNAIRGQLDSLGQGGGRYTIYGDSSP